MTILVLPGYALKMATPPLEKRVETAKLIFVGEVVKLEEKNGWVRAELLVKDPIYSVKKGDKVKVIWRKPSKDPRMVDGVTFDAKIGDKAIAILNDMHEGHYWLREDKFEPMKHLDEVRRFAMLKPRES